ncbi:MAG: hypothetical protein NZL90_05535, partial [Aquificaceae bacterium]|nr:hypothetical protein [Aquificaceae bacterium]
KDQELLRKLISNPRNPFETLIESIKQGNKEAIDELLNLCNCLRDEITSFSYLTELAKITNMPMSLLASRLKTAKKPKQDSDLLTYNQMAILKYAIQNGYEIKDINLTPQLISLIEKAKEGNLDEIPPEVFKMRLENAEEILKSIKDSEIELILTLESAEGIENIRNLLKGTVRLRGL